MTDYEKLTVAVLRSMLKDRGVPATGLTRKAQIVTRLQEQDAADAAKPSESSATLEQEVTEAPQVEADTKVQEEMPASPPDSMVAEVMEGHMTSIPDGQSEEYRTAANGFTSAGADVADAQINQDDAPTTIEPEQPAPPAERTSASTVRSLSQTPLPSKEETIAQSVPLASALTTPAPSREDTAATTQTDTDERKKRKRRSASPPIDTQELAIKRAKVEADVHLKEDVSQEPASIPSGQDISMSEAPTAAPESEREEARKDHGVEGKDMAPAIVKQNRDKETLGTKVHSDRPEIRASKDIRHQQSRPNEQENLDAPEPVLLEDLPTPAPSLHVASRALYIRNFMRPLQLQTLKTHLASLAGSPDTEVIETVYLDAVKTHAFIQVKSLAAAARIRAGMHDQVWPKERDRKPLWADYIPEEQLQKWISIEENAGSTMGARVGGRKWEVVYEHNGDEMVAHHGEVGSNIPPQNTTGAELSEPSQTRQRSVTKAIVGHANTQPKDIAKTFVALDEMFLSTKAKPMLYFKPVGNKVADDRLDELDYATSKRWSTRTQRDDDELRRYTFDDERLVETGIHYGKGSGGPNRSRGGRGGGIGRGAPRGPYRGGGNWHR